MASGLRHPELFGSIGSVSGSLVPRGDPGEKLPSIDERFGLALTRPGVAKSYKLIWIGCGTTDIGELRVQWPWSSGPRADTADHPSRSIHPVPNVS
jgi:hypothetical protein